MRVPQKRNSDISVCFRDWCGVVDVDMDLRSTGMTEQREDFVPCVRSHVRPGKMKEPQEASVLVVPEFVRHAPDP